MNYHQTKIPAGFAGPQKKKRNWRYWVGMAIGATFFCYTFGVQPAVRRQREAWQREQPHTSVTDGPNGTQTIEVTVPKEHVIHRYFKYSDGSIVWISDTKLNH